MTLYVRHAAWLHATPTSSGKGEVKSRRARFEAEEERGIERPQLEMPPLDGAAHLVDHLFAVGPMLGGEPLTHAEIAAWQWNTGHNLTSWEATTLRRLSGAYAGEYSAASEPNRPAPFTPAVQAPAVDPFARMAEILDSFALQDTKARR